MPTYKIDAKIEGKVATIYVRADNADNAYERLIESTFALGRHMTTITLVKDVPKGADSL